MSEFIKKIKQEKNPVGIKVMLADFLYNIERGPSYYLCPLNIGFIAAYAHKYHGYNFDFRLYRNVDKFINDFTKEPSDIVGFSQYIWNQDLTQNILKWIKYTKPEAISIFGGPMVGANEVDINTFLVRNPLVDFCVPFYGEYGFAKVLERYLQCDGKLEKMKSETIEGASFRPVGSGNKIVTSFVNQFIVKPEDIPSPYLTGFMDSFLAEGYSPIVQCMRGCPYSCSYCFANNLKIGKFPLERVIREIDYIYQRTTSSALAITDDNFGIFERDLDIAKHIRSLYDKRGYPNKLLLYHDKKLTKTVIEIVKIMKELCPFFISYQSRNPETLKAIDRYNLDNSVVIDIIRMCKRNNIHTVSEMIFGLPLETKSSFIKGIEELYKLNVDTIAVYNCKFFNGTKLARKDSIEKYQIKTKHRFYEDNFGIFKTNDDYGDIVACETDEIPVESSTYSFQDFMDIRKLGFWIELCLSKKIYYEALKHLENYGIFPVNFMSNIVDGEFAMSDEIQKFFLEMQEEYSNELFDTHDDLKKSLKSKLSKDQKFKSKKINLYFIYIILYGKLRAAFDSFMKKSLIEIVQKNSSESSFEEFLKPLDELFIYHNQRIVKPDYLNRKIIGEYDYDFIRWEKEFFTKPLVDYRRTDEKKIKIEFIINIPEQFEMFIKNSEVKKRPFIWHNYLYSSNIKAHCQYC